MISAHVNERWLPVSMPARALAFDIKACADKLALDLCGQSVTPHALKDAKIQRDRLMALIEQLDDEL